MSEVKLRQSVIGVHHHGCWGSLSTEPFPEVSMEESGPILIEKTPSGIILRATWKVTYPKKQIFEEYYASLKNYPKLRHAKILFQDDKNALLHTVWKSNTSSYDTVLKTGCLYASPVTQKQGYEIYTTLSEKPTQITRLMNELEQIGDVKVFKMGTFEKEHPFVLSTKQIHALQAALAHDYYSWPRKITLQELATTIRMSRRAFQENLRKAEMKIFPNMIRSVLERNQFAKQ